MISSTLKRLSETQLVGTLQTWSSLDSRCLIFYLPSSFLQTGDGSSSEFASIVRSSFESITCEELWRWTLMMKNMGN